MYRALVFVSLLLGLFAPAAAQESTDQPPAAGDAPQTQRRGREDGASPEALQRLTRLEQQLADKPDDKGLLASYLGSLNNYVRSATRSAERSVGREPAEAVRRFKLAQAAVGRIPEGIADEEATRTFERVRGMVAETEKKLARILKHDQLIGTQAAPLKALDWASGSPLTDSDLKGKVVLLDFFAVWCRPNIETFPELVKWREKYGDKDFAVVGLTKYYNYQWDERTQTPREATTGEVPPETERAMLQKFAELHGLKHSLGTQAGEDLYDFYGVTAVPQTVIIDRDGAIRFIRTGGKAENIPEIAAMLDKLLGDSAVGNATNSP